MTALTLRRSDPARNLHRYYRLDVQLDLFGPDVSSANGVASGRPVKPAPLDQVAAPSPEPGPSLVPAATRSAGAA
ncbi:MAG: hypothetical protein QOF90_94 [Acetobacteraceae bacterium]|nr:hypothetical protein [Acetobacteraceae bacterium]